MDVKVEAIKGQNSHYSHHSWANIIFSEGKQQLVRIRFENTCTGCGLCQINGVSQLRSLNREKALEVCKWLKTNLAKEIRKISAYAPGAVVATLGHSYHTNGHEKYLLEGGFELVSEYVNNAHIFSKESPKETQRLYILKLNYEC